jgi:hypothetical protein
MNKIILFILFAVPILVKGQTNSSVKVILNSSIETSFDSIFINPSNIESIVVERDSNGGTIYIQTKYPNWKYKSIRDILKNYPIYPQLIVYKTLTPAFYIDDKPINKITDAKIDESLFIDVSFKDLSRIKSIEMPCEKIVIVDIKLSATKPKIYIRGDSIQDKENYFKIKK